MSKPQKISGLKSVVLEDSAESEGGAFEFVPDELFGKTKHPFTTLIIGPNETGKTLL